MVDKIFETTGEGAGGFKEYEGFGFTFESAVTCWF